MKVGSTVIGSKFTPCSITIEFETQNELDLFGALFNNTRIANVLRSNGFNDPKNIYREVEKLGGNIDFYPEYF